MMKILLADDDSVTRIILRIQLTGWGFDVVEAKDGNEAWALLAEPDAPRLAVLDWMMPGLNGPEICEMLLAKQHGSQVGTYTVLLTARTETEDLVAALAAGAHTFLSKPVCPPVLKGHLEVGRRLIEAEDKLAAFASKMEELAERRARQLVEAKRIAMTDELTSLPNRRGFMKDAGLELDRAIRFRRPLSVLALDLDHFKRVNDTYGHEGGDIALRAFAEICRAETREHDLIGRVGGEELTVLLPECSELKAIQIAERLRRAVERAEICLSSETISLTVSIGVASVELTDTTIADLLRKADARLYEAKRRGRNRVCARSPDEPDTALKAPEPESPLARPQVHDSPPINEVLGRVMSSAVPAQTQPVSERT